MLSLLTLKYVATMITITIIFTISKNLKPLNPSSENSSLMNLLSVIFVGVSSFGRKKFISKPAIPKIPNPILTINGNHSCDIFQGKK